MASGSTTELLHVKAMEKEEARIKGIQERNKVRLERFLNARQRTIGLDVAALDAQVAEKQHLKDMEKQADKLEAARYAEICRILEGREYEERLARRAAIDSLKAEWEAQKDHLKDKRKKCLDFGAEPSDCGLASLQKLHGEDPNAAERKRMQSEQMRLWIAQQTEDKKFRELIDKEEEVKYANFLKEVSELSLTQQENDEAAAKNQFKALQHENLEQAMEKHRIKELERAQKLADDQALLERVKQDPMLSEANDYLVEGTGRIRRDHFRGYTAEQRNQVFHENNELIHERALQKNKDDWKEKVWAAQQEMWRQRLQEEEWEEQRHRKLHNLQQLQELLAQKDEHDAKVARSRVDKFGAVTDGFFQGFGKSCR